FVVYAFEPILKPTCCQFQRQGTTKCTDAGICGILDFLELTVAPRTHDQFLFACTGSAGVFLQANEIIDVALVENVVPAAVVVNRDMNLVPMSRHVSAVIEFVVEFVLKDLLQHCLGLLPFKPVLIHLFAEDAADKTGLFVSARPSDHHKSCSQMWGISHGRFVGGDTHGCSAIHSDLAV